MDAGAVDFDIEDRNRGTHGNRQLQLHAPSHFGLLDAHDLGSDLLGVPLHRLGAELDAGQQLDLFSSQVEVRIAARHRGHATDSRREFMILDAQCRVHRIGRMRAVAADVGGTLEANRTHDGDHGLEAQFLVVGRLTTTAGDRPWFGRTLAEKVGENGRTDTLHPIPNQRLNRFPIDLPAPPAVGEDLSGEAAYFAEGFLLDRFESFFPEWAVRPVPSAAIGKSRR